MFLALWPDGEARAALCAARDVVARTMAGQWVKPDNLHVTLAFLGEVAQERWPGIVRVADAIKVPSFTLTLDRAEFWPRNGIVCLGAGQAPQPLSDLAQGLAQGLKQAGFILDQRPYRPHLTLARKGRSGRTALVLPEPVAWRVDACSLVESRLGREGATYTPRQTWRLQNVEAIPGSGSVG
ncbi:RNA 2',3'-cyclic phosphodiesterase [Methylomagnum ishizawai]|nr:RNA 2',3'-cyclic phosphodiesterase [Methylomagnum ishizawai]